MTVGPQSKATQHSLPSSYCSLPPGIQRPRPRVKSGGACGPQMLVPGDWQDPASSAHSCLWEGFLVLIRWSPVTGRSPSSLAGQGCSSHAQERRPPAGPHWDSWSHQSSGLASEVGEERLGPRVGPLNWLGTIWDWNPFQGASTPPPSLSCRIRIRVVGARVSYLLPPGGCSCSACSVDRKTLEWTDRRETRQLQSSAPCRLQGGTAARAVPPYYPLFLGLHRDSESHPEGCLGGRMTKVTLAPPTRPRPLRAPRAGGAELLFKPCPVAPGQLHGFHARRDPLLAALDILG